MANIQYIGARYVPKFYLNPDDNSNNWKSGVVYEPLTVVEYLSESYTSKIPVPASVGDPASNPIYWAKTGAYNAAISTLQGEVSQINNTISDYDDIKSMVGWSKIKSTYNLDLVKTITTLTDLSTGEYLEDMTFDSKRDLLYFATSLNKIIALNPTNYNVIATYSLTLFGKIACIDYNSDTDRVYISSVSNNILVDGWHIYILKPNDMSIANSFVNWNGRLIYDNTRHQNIQFASDPAYICKIYLLDDSFTVEDTLSFIFDDNGGAGNISQGACCDDGVIYTASRNTLFQFDILNNRYLGIELTGDVTGEQEIEGFYIYNDDIYVPCMIGTRYPQLYGVNIYKNGNVALHNMASVFDKFEVDNFSDIYDVQTPINNGDDLDNYKSLGNFYKHSTTTVLNGPSELSGSWCTLKIIRAGGGSSAYRKQIITDRASSISYERIYDGSTWGDWSLVQSGVNLINALTPQHVQIGANESKYFKMVTDGNQGCTQALVMSGRDGQCGAFYLNYWTDIVAEFANIGPYTRLSVSKDPSSFYFTLTNNVGGRTDAIVIGATEVASIP